MARQSKSEEEKQKDIKALEERINSFKDSIADYDYKKFIKTCDTYPIEPDEAFKLLMDKFIKGDVKFVANTIWS